MGADYVIYVGEVPVKSHNRDAISLMLGNLVELDWEKGRDQPRLSIGECSFLKSAIFESGRETFIPGPIEKLVQLIPEYQSGESRVIDDSLLAYVREAVKVPNTTSHELYKSPEEIVSFFEQHKGEKCYSVAE